MFKHKISAPGNRVSVLLAAQSASGYLWLATDSGLVRHNGNDEVFFAFPVGSAKPSALFFDADTGYVGFSDGSVSVFRNGIHTPVGWLEGTPHSGISALGKDNRGNLWLGTKDEGIYVHDGRYLFHFGKEDGLPAPEINDLAADAAGNVWVATDRGLARLRFENRRKTVRVWDDGLPDPLLTALAVAGNTVYVGSHSGNVFSVDARSGETTVLRMDSAAPVVAVTDLWADETELWGLDASGGIFMYAPRRSGEYLYIENRRTGAEGRIRSLTGDDEFNLWLSDGSENVLRIFRGLLHLDEHETVPLHKISSVSCNRNGWVYFASEEGLFGHPVLFGSGRTLRRIPDAGGSVSREAISVYADPSGNVWSGSFGNGMSVFEPASGKTFRFTEKNGFLNDNVLHIAGQGKSLWAATLGGVVFLEGGLRGKMHFIGPQNGMPVGFNYCVGIDSVNRLTWVGTDGGGLVEIGPDFSIRPLGGGPSTVYCLSVLPGTGVVFSGQRPGLWGYNGRQLFNFSTDFRFFRITPTGLAVLPDSAVLVSHTGGFERFYPFRKSNTSFGEAYGIGRFENALNALSVDEYGNCWLASDDELLRLSAIPSAYRKAPKTVLEQILVQSEPADPGETVFTHDRNSFTFTFSGIWFQDPKNVSFAYKMDGIDAGWNVTGDHYANYPALPPGRYTFRLKSSATGSFLHRDEVTYSFEIRKPFWEEAWFYVPLVLAALFLLYALIRARDKRMADRERIRKENAEFRFQVLKNQISPHFLFNSFNTLLYLIDSDTKKASGYTEELSDFFRKVLEVREQNLITLREELELMELYASLQRSRFGNALALELTLPEDLSDSFIPPLSGQMLLENAIKHNTVATDSPLVFRVGVDETGKWLSFSNNIQRRRHPAESTGIGLKNIIQRYRLLDFPEPKLRDDGVTFTVLLPLIR